jgi:hypothetical protein
MAVFSNISLANKKMLWTNTLAFCVTASETNIKSVIKLAPGWTIEIVGTERETTNYYQAAILI